ncbi:MAG: DoxX family protein, partial [Pseudobdellovibrionaceae bacterium]
IQAPLVSALELGAGLFILLGLFTRRSCLPLIAIMLVAIRTAKWEEVSDFSSLLGIPEFLYLVILSWLLIYGSNYLSVDALLSKFSKKGTGKPG